ncbi:MAG: hypothetical protein OXF79_16720 [Chloroflexi bacterium]|nr:hypothetical protein [Chloroflexota bacterium]
MQQATDMLQPVVTDELRASAQEVIQTVHRNARHAFLLDAKLGDAETGPMFDADIATSYDKPLYSIGTRWKDLTRQIAQADAQHGNPLSQIAHRANDVIARAAILNRHNRRPPLYAESTINSFIQLDYARPEHSPIIRAAGHVVHPPVFPLNHDLNLIIPDVAAHMAASHERQSAEQILRSIKDHQGLLAKWPHLDLPLFIRRAMDIRPDNRGCYHPEQPWGRFISAQRLVASTMLRIFARDGEPHHTAYLTNEVERLVGQFLPKGYNTLGAVRATLSKSDDISWQGPSTFGLRKWETALDPRSIVSNRGTTGDLIYAFLIRHGPADTDEIIGHVQRNSTAKKRTVQAAINHDPANRFIRSADGRVAINPIPQNLNPDAPALKITPDGHRHRPAPILRQSELLWLTHYVQALNDLEPPLPPRAAITGTRAAGFASDDLMEITVVVDDRDRANLESRLAQAAEVASEAVPSVQPQISILSAEQWTERMDGATPEAHHNIWLAPHTTSRRGGA